MVDFSLLGGQYGYGGAPPAGGAYGGAPGYGAQPYSTYPGQQPYHGTPAAYGQAPTIDPQIQQWFMSVDHDKSGRITAHELQKALINTNWTAFNEETCRLMIGMFDKDFSGTIDLYEFQALWHYIQQWRATFDSFDSNKSGSIESHELHQAYQRMGYNVSPQFIQTIVIKFDHYGRRALTLDNFIQSCVMLKSLTDAFRQRDTTMTGVVRMSYEDFMQLAVLNKP
ncbi:peflin-like isoform X1 [Biomphalaria glabrata]|uniref:Peflin-like isoform X1 n=1 Tax=Biomphalaria glabrata TaxID=6526 RepID=A0A2C9JYC7_BIOGL|nr:peflin-like isoform X1 [Biomphalaria glabrata]